MKRSPGELSIGVQETSPDPSRRQVVSWLVRIGASSLLANAGGCGPNFYGTKSSYEWGNFWEKRTKRIPSAPMPSSEVKKRSMGYFLEGYTRAQKYTKPELSFGTAPNIKGSPTYVNYMEYMNLHRKWCEKGSYNSRNLTLPKKVETATAKHKKGESTVPIVRMEGKITDSFGKYLDGIGIKGLPFYEPNMIIVDKNVKQPMIVHEATHLWLHKNWEEKGFYDFDETAIKAGDILTPYELTMLDINEKNPVNIAKANETVCYAMSRIATKDDPYYIQRGLFTLGLSVMNIMTSMLKNKRTIVKNGNYKKFDPRHLLMIFNRWSNKPWAEEAARYAGKKSPWTVLVFAKKDSQKTLGTRRDQRSSGGSFICCHCCRLFCD